MHTMDYPKFTYQIISIQGVNNARIQIFYQGSPGPTDRKSSDNVFFIIFISLVLNLFCSVVQWLIQRKISLNPSFSRSHGVLYFPGGGLTHSSGGGV